MGKRIPFINGDEYDFLTKFYRSLCKKYKRLHRSFVKRNYRRRERRIGKVRLKEELLEYGNTRDNQRMGGLRRD